MTRLEIKLYLINNIGTRIVPNSLQVYSVPSCEVSSACDRYGKEEGDGVEVPNMEFRAGEFEL